MSKGLERVGENQKDQEIRRGREGEKMNKIETKSKREKNENREVERGRER